MTYSYTKKDALQHPFEYIQRYEIITPIESVLFDETNNYQHLLISRKCLKSFKKGLKISFNQKKLVFNQLDCPTLLPRSYMVFVIEV